MKKQFLILSSAILLAFMGCEEKDLQQSIFVSDPDFPELPQYSEWGYNTFGAYYDRTAFISNDWEVPIKVIVNEGTTSLVFKGQRGAYNNRKGGYNNNYAYTAMSLRFNLGDFAPDNYTDLIMLNDTTFDLSNPRYSMVVSIDNAEYEADVLNGTLAFKRAQQLLVDSKQVEVILSGVFELEALVNEIPVSISNGRFDVGVGEDNFFNY